MATDRLGEPLLIHTFTQPLRTAAGEAYVVAAYGQQRTDGTWIGWLEFMPTGASAVLRTRRETTQPSREHLAYWATGLEPVYLEGAFARAS